MKNQWTIDIKAAPKGGFNYTIHGINVSGFEPTRTKLAAIIGETIVEYLPESDFTSGPALTRECAKCL